MYAIRSYYALSSPVLAANLKTESDVDRQALPQLAAHIGPQSGIENIEERREAVTTESTAPLTYSLGSTRFTLSGLIEAEASLAHVEGGDEEDDLRLSTVQIDLDAEFTSWLGGRVIGLWEEEDTEPMVRNNFV